MDASPPPPHEGKWRDSDGGNHEDEHHHKVRLVQVGCVGVLGLLLESACYLRPSAMFVRSPGECSGSPKKFLEFLRVFYGSSIWRFFTIDKALSRGPSVIETRLL